MEPFAPDNQDPEPLQMLNELHRSGYTMKDFGVALTKLRTMDRSAYKSFVKAVRAGR